MDTEKTSELIPQKNVKNNLKKDPRGAKTHYHPKWTPLVVKSLIQIGKSTSYVCRVLEITQPTLLLWAKKYPELKRAIQEGRKPVDEAVISALYKSAVGYVIKETIYGPEQLSEKEQAKRAKMKNPPPLTFVPVQEKHHYVKGNTTAQMFWLTNRRPDEWKDRHDMDIIGKVEYTVVPFKETKNETNQIDI